MYALASVLSALLVVGASLVGVVVHFTLKVGRYDQEIIVPNSDDVYIE